MKRIKTLSLITLVIFTLSACRSHKTEDLSLLKKLETDLNSSMNIKVDDKKVTDYVDACKKFVGSYPGDSVCSTLLLKAGRLEMNLTAKDRADESIILFDQVDQDYPHSKEAPVAMFMKGFYLENNMKNIQKAGDTYREFLRKYPNHQLAKDAKASLDNLGKPLDQIIKEFEAKHKDSSSVAKK